MAIPPPEDLNGSTETDDGQYDFYIITQVLQEFIEWLDDRGYGNHYARTGALQALIGWYYAYFM